MHRSPKINFVTQDNLLLDALFNLIPPPPPEWSGPTGCGPEFEDKEARTVTRY
jgi:hypothetical protein